MSHELRVVNGRADMAFVGETPWHGLGQQLTAGASIEEWQHAAGMAHKIARSRVRYGEGPNQRIIDDKHVLFRSDTKEWLGIVSDQYKIVQPREVLEFFRDLSTEAGFQLETAGTLFGGRKYWALAYIGENAVIAGRNDVLKGYLLLTSSADGTSATVAKFTTVRVVCNNTLSAAMSHKDASQVSISHKLVFDHNAVKDRLGIARGRFAGFAKEMQKLATKPVSPAFARQLCEELLAPEQTDQEKLDKVRESRAFKNILNLFNGAGRGSRLDGVQSTAWGFLNAVTEHVDHFAHAHTQDARLDSAFFGKGDDLKTRAVELLTV